MYIKLVNIVLQLLDFVLFPLTPTFFSLCVSFWIISYSVLLSLLLSHSKALLNSLPMFSSVGVFSFASFCDLYFVVERWMFRIGQ